MPSCNQTLSGLTKDCSTSIGGILEVYIANDEDVSGVTVTTGEITAITMATGKKFLTYQFAKGTANMTSNYIIDATTGTRYVETLLSLIFNRMETAKRLEITALAQNDLKVIAKDANGKYWFLGYNEPVNATTADAQTGTARSDRNGYGVTLQDIAHELPMEVDPDIIENIVS